MWKIKLVSLLTIILFFQSPIPAEANVGEKVVAVTIKSVVKVVVATTNIKKVKKRIINKLEKTDNQVFRMHYAKFYEIIKDLPPDIKATYKVTPYMTKEQMIKNIESVDKKEIYRIVNRIPNKTVIELFKVYRSQTRMKRKTNNSK